MATKFRQRPPLDCTFKYYYVHILNIYIQVEFRKKYGLLRKHELYRNSDESPIFQNNSSIFVLGSTVQSRFSVTFGLLKNCH